MNNDLALLINQGFFKGPRKELIADLFNSKNLNCYVINNEFFLKSKNFSIIINDDSSSLIGDDSSLSDCAKYAKEKLYKIAKKAVLKKKSLLKNNFFEFINYYLNPLVLECFIDFKLDFSKIANNLKKKGLSAFFSNNFFSIQFKNTHYSILLDKNFKLKDIDYSIDFFSLKNDELFVGFPYCVKFLSNPYKDFIFNGSLMELKIIANALIDELSDQFI